MWTRIRNYILPAQDDPDEVRRRGIVGILSRGLLILSIVGLAVILIFLFLNPGRWKQADNQLTVISAVVAILASLGVYQINKRSSRIASFLLLLLLVVVSTFSDTPKELSNGRSLFIFTLPIAISSLIFAPPSSFFFATLNSVIVYLLALQANLIPNVTAIVGFYMLAFISWLSSRNLEQALKDLRVINAELDQRVIERTRELSESRDREADAASQREAILNSIADGVVVFDNHGTATVANPSLAALTGLPQANVLGHGFSELLASDELSPNERERVRDILQNAKNIPTFRIGWGPKTLSVNAAEVRSVAGEPLGTVAVFRDVTQEAEIEKMKDAFLAVVSHELRTPLNSILGFAEMIKENVYGPVSDSQKRASVRIMENTKRLLSIVSELLDQAQIQSGRMKINREVCEPSDLLNSLRETMETIAREKGVDVTTELDPAMPAKVMGDSQRLLQILINLTNNAVKFSDNGQEVHVSIHKSEADKWQIKVTDTGGGIPQDAQAYIFDTFRQVESAVTRKHGGVGLGLAIVKQLVELMEGDIVVDSKVGVGSTFTVTLPLIEG